MIEYRNRNAKWIKHPLIVLCTAIVIGLAGCGKDSSNNPTGPDPDPDPDPTDPDTTATNTTLIQSIEEHEDLSVLYQAIIDAGLENSLDAEGSFTILAPVNSAFDSLPEGYTIDNLSQEQLKALVGYHIIPSGMSSEELGGQASIQTLQGDSIFVRTSGASVEINRGELHGGSSITEAGIKATNGTLHKINEVLLPDSFLDVLAIADKRYNLTKFVCSCTTGEAGLQDFLEDPEVSLTVFVPTDAAFGEVNVDALPGDQLKAVLEYHIVEQAMLSGDLSDGQTITTRNGTDLTINVGGDGTLTLNSGAATILEADLEGINGVVYIIDSVLTPPAPGS